MGEKPLLDLSTIAGGSVVSYASLKGDIESWMGLLLLFATVMLTLMRIMIAINDWRKQNKK
ncbi:MAG: hypothetical protein HRU29_03190 [Rhizobiales bacterium]|nr:hypothetical protein [Hyphomicrobiales bacterium]NRB13383.1 hypothetical protein [Hyphomicrobiales bacterium]